jgi:hypothetical protein
MRRGKPFTFVAAVIFGIMALVHLYRLAAPFEVVIGPCHLPQWASIIALVVTGGLSWMLLRESRR